MKINNYSQSFSWLTTTSITLGNKSNIINEIQCFGSGINLQLWTYSGAIQDWNFIWIKTDVNTLVDRHDIGIDSFYNINVQNLENQAVSCNITYSRENSIADDVTEYGIFIFTFLLTFTFFLAPYILVMRLYKNKKSNIDELFNFLKKKIWKQK